ncbi:MAG: DNA-binding protein [Myxococcaceae bacterium]
MDAPKTRRENEVWQACDDLWALNTNLEALKGDAIRDQLLSLGYKKGSPNEIYKYRASWKESRGISEKSLAQTVEVADPISRAVSLVYEQIQNETQQKIIALQTESSNQFETLSKQNQELCLTYEALQENHEALATEKEGLEINLELVRENLSLEQQKNTELKLRLEGLELLLSELKATYAAQISKLEQQLKQQGYLSSEEINKAKLEARSERDLKIQAEAHNKKLMHDFEVFQKRTQKQQEQLFKKEFQKLTTLVKKLKPKPVRSKKSPAARTRQKAHPRAPHSNLINASDLNL